MRPVHSCGSRRRRSRVRTAPRRCCRSWRSYARTCVACSGDDLDPAHAGSAGGMCKLLPSWAPSRAADLGHESGIGRGKRHAEGVDTFAGTLATTLERLKAYPESKGWSSRATGTSKPPSCPGGSSAPRPTSTPSSPPGWPSPTPGWCAPPRPPGGPAQRRSGRDAAPATSGPKSRVGSTGSGWDATTTSARQQRLLCGPHS
jgi:hypothetical protein